MSVKGGKKKSTARESIASSDRKCRDAKGLVVDPDTSTRIISPEADKAFVEFPLADSAVLHEIQDAEVTAKQAACQIAQMREQIQALTQKDELSPAEMKELQNKQKDIICKLAEFEDVTKKIQQLVGLTAMTCKDGGAEIGGGICNDPNTRPTAPQGAIPQLPRVIIPTLTPATQAQMAPVIMTPMSMGQQIGGPDPGGWYQPTGQPMAQWPPICPDGEQLPQQQVVFPQCNPVPFNQPPQTIDNQAQPLQGVQNDPCMPPVQPNPCPPQEPPEDCSPILVKQLTEKLDASYKIQEKLACENKEMECQRYQLQEELLTRDKLAENLCKQLESLQCELKLICSENNDLKKQVNCLNDGNKKQTKCCKEQEKPLCKMTLSKDPICKMDLYKQMGLPLPKQQEMNPCEPNNPCKAPQMGDMDQVVSCMEDEVRAMQKELQAVQAERRSLDLQKKLLKCAAPRNTTTFPQCKNQQMCKKQIEIGASTVSSPQLEIPKPPPCPPPCPPPKPTPQCMRELECQLKELSQQYSQLNQDFNDKVAEISILRVEADKFREEKKCLLLKKEEDQNRIDNILNRVKQLEDEKEKWSGAKGAMLDIEQQMIMCKQKYLEKQELEDEMKILIDDQTQQLEEYRNKYIKAQEIVEGQRRDMDIMQKNHLRFSEQLTKELKQAKEEFQKRLEELSRLPDILKNTQLKLQESEQMRMIAEQNVEQLTGSVEELREKLEIMQMELEKISVDANEQKDNQDHGKLKLVVSELEEKVLELERHLEGKRQHVIMLEGEVESQREESARAVSRTKERCDVVRRGLQNQIGDLEVQLAQARASARAANKDRDMIREKMECQVQKLTKNFEEAQNWVKCLQSHVGFLKSSNRDLEFHNQPVECLPKTFQPIAID